MKPVKMLLLSSVLVLCASLVLADSETVTSLGDGWISGDTRNNGSITFVPGPGTPTEGSGSVRLQTTENIDKATIEKRGSFGSLASFTATYEWYRAVSSPAPAPGLKLGIDTADPNPTGATAVARGEDRFDKILIYEPYLNPLGRTLYWDTWTVETISQSSGAWWIVDLDGDKAPGYGQSGPLLTLGEWLSDSAYGAVLSGGNLVSIQLGVGSYNGTFDGNVDYILYTLDDGVHFADFEAEVVIDGCETGVSDGPVGDEGLLSELLDACGTNAKNHGQFVKCIARLTNDLKREGILTSGEKAAIQACAAKADIP